MQKELGEGSTQEEDDPKNGEKKEPHSPRDPNDPRHTSPDDPEAGNSTRPPSVPAWFARLPAQIRDMLVRGDFEQVPAEYRERIQEFLHWLMTQERGNEPGR